MIMLDIKIPTMKNKERIIKIAVVSVIIFLLIFTGVGYLATRSNLTEAIDIDVSANVSKTNFVTKSGRKFMLDGKEFKFVGFNLFDGAATDFYKCGYWERYTDKELDTAMKYAKDKGGSTVLRSWAFQAYTKSGTDWTGIDKLIRIAKANNFKLILALENGAGHCQQGNNGQAKYQYENDSWYSNGYTKKYGSNKKTYPEYVDAIVKKYKDEPTIMAWELVNEPDTSRRTNGVTDCRSGTQTVLTAFAKDISNRIRAIDSKHLITLGAQSNGVCGSSGPDYVEVNSLPNIDFGTIHDYGYWADTTRKNLAQGEKLALPGSTTNGNSLPSLNSTECKNVYGARMACSISYAMQTLNKPIIIEEAGVSTARYNMNERANIFELKIKTAFAQGVSGYLVWQLNKVIDTEKYDVLTSNNDPLFAIMKKYAGK